MMHRLGFWLGGFFKKKQKQIPGFVYIPADKNETKHYGNIDVRLVRSSPTAPPVETKVIYDPDADFWDISTPLKVSANLQIKYCDATGNRSERIIDVQKFGNNGKGSTLLAICRLRNEYRTFRSDRIKECIDVNTGEVIADVTEFLTKNYESTPVFVASKMIEAEFDTVKILYYLAKADGRFTSKEKKIVCDICRTVYSDSRLTDNIIDDAIRELDVPSERVFKSAINRTATRSASHKQLLLQAAKDMIATEKTVHRAEEEALQYMESKFN